MTLTQVSQLCTQLFLRYFSQTEFTYLFIITLVAKIPKYENAAIYLKSPFKIDFLIYDKKGSLILTQRPRSAQSVSQSE
ncbi:MAG: hypothetical protein ACE5HS_04225, partial [bacterium]